LRPGPPPAGAEGASCGRIADSSSASPRPTAAAACARLLSKLTQSPADSRTFSSPSSWKSMLPRSTYVTSSPGWRSAGPQAVMLRAFTRVSSGMMCRPGAPAHRYSMSNPASLCRTPWPLRVTTIAGASALPGGVNRLEGAMPKPAATRARLSKVSDWRPFSALERVATESPVRRAVSASVQPRLARSRRRLAPRRPGSGRGLAGGTARGMAPAKPLARRRASGLKVGDADIGADRGGHAGAQQQGGCAGEAQVARKRPPQRHHGDAHREAAD